MARKSTKTSSRPSRGAEEWAALVAESVPPRPLPPVVKRFEEGDSVAYRGEGYSVLYQNGNWVRLTSGGKEGETFVVYADLLIAIINKRGAVRDDAMDEKDAIRVTSANDPKSSKREAVKDLVREALSGASNRKDFIKAGERLSIMSDDLREYIDEIDWSSANPGVMRMRLGNIFRGKLMKAPK